MHHMPASHVRVPLPAISAICLRSASGRSLSVLQTKYMLGTFFQPAYQPDAGRQDIQVCSPNIFFSRGLLIVICGGESRSWGGCCIGWLCDCYSVERTLARQRHQRRKKEALAQSTVRYPASSTSMPEKVDSFPDSFPTKNAVWMDQGATVELASDFTTAKIGPYENEMSN